MITSRDAKNLNNNEEYLNEINRLNRQIASLKRTIQSCRQVERENNKMIDALISRNKYLEQKLSESSTDSSVYVLIKNAIKIQNRA